jgi:hypothetical protein
MNLDKEPAVIVSTLTAFITALVGFGAAFGLDLTDAQRNAVIGVVAPAVAVIFLLGPIIRQFVFSPHTVQQKVTEAAAKGATGEVQSPVTK